MAPIKRRTLLPSDYVSGHWCPSALTAKRASSRNYIPFAEGIVASTRYLDALGDKTTLCRACRWHNTASRGGRSCPITRLHHRRGSRKYFPRCFRSRGSRRNGFFHKTSRSRTRRRNRRFGDRTGFSRTLAIGSAQLPIMDTCLAALLGFSPFPPGRARRKTAGSRWRRCLTFCSLPPARKSPFGPASVYVIMPQRAFASRHLHGSRFDVPWQRQCVDARGKRLRRRLPFSPRLLIIEASNWYRKRHARQDNYDITSQILSERYPPQQIRDFLETRTIPLIIPGTLRSRSLSRASSFFSFYCFRSAEKSLLLLGRIVDSEFDTSWNRNRLRAVLRDKRRERWHSEIGNSTGSLRPRQRDDR